MTIEVEQKLLIQTIYSITSENLIGDEYTTLVICFKNPETP